MSDDVLDTSKSFAEINATFAKGKALFHAGQFRLSERYWEEYLSHEPESVTGYYYLSVCKSVQRNGEEGLRLAERALEVEPDCEWGYLAQSTALCSSGRGIEALTAIDQALEKAPERLQAIAFSAWLHAHFGSHQKAKERAEQGLRTDPEDLWCHLTLARLMTLRGDHLDATEYLKQHLNKKPENPWLIEQLAWATLPKDRKMAEELFETALELNPECQSARQGLLLGKRVPHLGILWNLPHSWLKGTGPLLVAYLLSFYPSARFVLVLFTIIWLNRAYSNLVLSLGRYRRLLTEKEMREGPVTLGTFVLGLGVWNFLDPASGLLICLMSFVWEQHYDGTLTGARVPKQIPLILGSYLTAWFWNPWYWAVGYLISWLWTTRVFARNASRFT